MLSYPPVCQIKSSLWVTKIFRILSLGEHFIDLPLAGHDDAAVETVILTNGP